MTIDIERERREFEALKSVRGYVRHESWSHTEGYMIRASSDYVDSITQAQWEGWLAAKRAAVGSAEPVAVTSWKTVDGVRCDNCEKRLTEHDNQRYCRTAPPAPVSAEPVADMVWMPRRLTAENGAKSELSGEFSEKVEIRCPECEVDNADEDCELCNGKGHWMQDVPVEWSTIKNIYRKAVEVCAAAPPSTDAKDSAATIDVITERNRQKDVEGWTPERDDKYIDCQLAAAAATYALCTETHQLQVCGVNAWPWSRAWWKPTTYRRNLVKAGALIIAEIERLDRKDVTPKESP